MVGSRCCVRGSPWQRYASSPYVDDKAVFGIAFEDPSDITDVVQKAGNDQMSVVIRFNALG